ncbi:MAG: tRNA (adenosine(37)-N6)-dimethylallyltransferase MiaA [Lentisphaeria bacterium]|nr:tRNA (adenosine(37)-N6)-dimethylallyltransferase MiaA [Lentisphaeria bacterium]
MKDALVIMGPTCSWKSAVAARLARKLDGEVVSFDSMQVYKGLPIGTAQPGPDELSLAPHHLVDCLEISEVWNVNLFVPKALEVISEIASRGRTAVLAGGTGLYARALVYGFSLMPSDPEIAESLRAESATPDGCARLREELAAAGEIPEDIARNPRHLARAVEVFRITGTPPWELKKRNEEPQKGFRQFCILPDLTKLKERIRKRTDAMLERGWIQECERALENGLATAPTAWQALGYRDIAQWLENGRVGGLDAIREILSNRTIQYARRQLTWFKHQHPGAVLIDVQDFSGDVPQRILDEILVHLEK